MDKRSLTAILITFGILIAWQMVYVRPRQQEAARARIEQAREDSIAAAEAEEYAALQPESTIQEPAAEQAAPAVERAPEGGGFFSEGGEEISVTVDTGPMVVRLTSRGGEIQSVELPRYERFGGGFVELVPEGMSGGVSLSVEKGGRWTGLSGVRFSTLVNGREALDGERVVLGEGTETAEIVFVRESPDGGLIEKRFRFVRGGYEAGLTIAIGREGELRDTGAYSVSWSCGLALNEKDTKWETRQMASMGRVGEDIYTEAARSFGKTGLKEQEGVVVWAGVRSKYFLTAILTGTQRTG